MFRPGSSATISLFAFFLVVHRIAAKPDIDDEIHRVTDELQDKRAELKRVQDDFTGRDEREDDKGSVPATDLYEEKFQELSHAILDLEDELEHLKSLKKNHNP